MSKSYKSSAPTTIMTFAIFNLPNLIHQNSLITIKIFLLNVILKNTEHPYIVTGLLIDLYILSFNLLLNISTTLMNITGTLIKCYFVLKLILHCKIKTYIDKR